MSGPLVSCVIPVRDGATYLAQAIDSVLVQTHRSIEVIVVDDGSTDDSAGVAQAYGAPVRVLRHPEPRGPSASRADGVTAARGELVAFLDADDIWDPERLAAQVAHLADESRLEVSFCMMENFWEPGHEAEEARWRAAGRVRGSWMMTTALARRGVLDRVPIPEQGSQHADHLRWALALRDADVAVGVLDRVLVRRRRHGDNLSRRQSAEHFDDLFAVLKASLDLRARGPVGPMDP